jgi:nucleoid-associated protein YgaU
MALEKALITNSDTGRSFPVLFNPEEYTINRDNNFAQVAVPGLQAPLLQFIHGNMQTLDMELLIDTYESHSINGKAVNRAGDDVRLITSQITGLLDINPETHAPPVLLFTWGSLSFTCVLAKAAQRYIMFRPDGVPVRARLTVSFQEFTNADLEPKEVKRETSDYSKTYTVAQGDTLSGIASRLYQDPAMWRPIAMMNAIDNPRALQTGQQLRIPPLPFLDPETGEVVQ